MASPVVDNNEFIYLIKVPMKNGKYTREVDDVATELYKEVSQQFPHFQNIPPFYFSELVGNSYDGYRALTLNEGANIGKKRLVLHVNVERSEMGVIVKLQDNGQGFPNRAKNEQFVYERKKDRVQKDYKQGMIGGSGVGLAGYIEKVEKAGGYVFLQNKDIGCAVESLFPGM